MTWLIAAAAPRVSRHPDAVVSTSLRCGSCDGGIGGGEVYARVTGAGLVRCHDCAATMLVAGWDASGVCPWPLRLEADAARPDTVALVDFEARLRAALERGRRAA